jgi:hypothetical protein
MILEEQPAEDVKVGALAVLARARLIIINYTTLRKSSFVRKVNSRQHTSQNAYTYSWHILPVRRRLLRHSNHCALLYPKLGHACSGSDLVLQQKCRSASYYVAASSVCLGQVYMSCFICTPYVCGLAVTLEATQEAATYPSLRLQ